MSASRITKVVAGVFFLLALCWPAGADELQELRTGNPLLRDA